MAEHDSAEHQLFAQFLGFRFDHQHRIAGTSDHEVELGFLHLVDVRVKHILAVDVADAGTTNRTHERNARECQRCGSGNDRQDVRIVLEIVLHNGDDDLGVVLVAVGEERTDRAIDQAGNQRFLFARTTFTLEVATRDLAGGVGLFLVVDGQRKEIETGLGLLGRNDGGQNHGLAISRQHGAISLARDLAGLEDERTAAPFDFHFVLLEHILSFICGRGRAIQTCATPPSWLLCRAATGKTTGGLKMPGRRPCKHPAILPHDRPRAVSCGPLPTETGSGR